jgi:hypothetical protein
MNIARLTSLPFLHAAWAGIHGLYDTLGWSILGLSLTLLTVILQMSYLKYGLNF